MIFLIPQLEIKEVDLNAIPNTIVSNKLLDRRYLRRQNTRHEVLQLESYVNVFLPTIMNVMFSL